MGNGQICGGNSQCTSSICGGRCCPGPAFCSCSQPSAANLVPNAGFDSGLPSWTVPSSSGTVSWTSDDAEACPYSGAASIVAGALASDEAASNQSQLQSPCLGVSPSTSYNFGGKLKGYGLCQVNLYQNSNCTAALAGGGGIPANNNPASWPSNTNSAFSSGNAHSAIITCTGGSSAGLTLHIDMIYLTPAPGSF